jgi:serine/threonine-protein kinase
VPTDQLSALNSGLAGRYALERELGHGGMATVYLADDLRHDRKVAIKILRPELALAIGPERFAREIAIAARLSHPRIVALYDSGLVDGRLFYVMPYIRGESLRQRLDRDGELPVDEAVALVRQVGTALDFAHAQGLVHRDIKPENILLFEGEPMVTDFGIALTAAAGTDPRLTTDGLALGTPHYMSPEQAAGDTVVDGRSHVYSLACVLYELLTGEPPFTGPTVQAVVTKRFLEPAPSVQRLRPRVPAAVDQAIARALAREPAERFPTCEAFVLALTSAKPVAPAEPSVAVLPFVDLSRDPENEFFADGMTEDVIAQLSKIRSLKVISRSSAMRFRDRGQGLPAIGATLGVATLLDGSVRRAGDRIRIVAQLVDARADRPLWSETYDRHLTDVFAIQTDVALKIAAALEAELLPQEQTRIRQEPTASMEAYQAYLRGRSCHVRYTEENMLKAIEYFRQAIAADPDYAPAHAGMALAAAEVAMGVGGGSWRPEVAYQEAREAVTRALTLDPELADGHGVLALIKMAHDFDWAGAEREFKTALALSPGSADTHDHYGWLCGALERWDEAVVHVKRAQELDPLVHRADVGSTLIRAGRYDEALSESLRSVEFDPTYARGRSTLGWAYLKKGQVDLGLANLEEAVRLDPASSLYLAQLGQAYAETGRVPQARTILARLEAMRSERYVSPYHMAYVHTGLGEPDRALDYLEQAFRERAGALYGIKGSFLFAQLRGHPRFEALLARMNLG